MKKTLILAALMVALAGGSFGEGSTLSDAQVRFALNWIYGCFDGDHQSDLNALFAQDMGFDTNQFVRVAKVMAESNERPRQMLAIISKYDIQEGIPYLYGYTTNENSKVAFTACRLILGREGLTSNSVVAVETFLSTTNASRDAVYNRDLLCRLALREAYKEGTPDDLRARSHDAALALVGREGIHAKSIDKEMLSCNAEFRFSDERLTMLRSSQMHELNDFVNNYVTNAIHEIEAQLHPE